MGVIAHLRIPADAFELGRILAMGGDTTVELTSMVPLGERPVPPFTVHDHDLSGVESEVRKHPAVDDLQITSEHDGETVFALDRNVERAVFFQGVGETRAHLLSSRGTEET